MSPTIYKNILKNLSLEKFMKNIHKKTSKISKKYIFKKSTTPKIYTNT